jgi:hypothetical protein
MPQLINPPSPPPWSSVSPRVLPLGTLEHVNHGMGCSCTLLAKACGASEDAVTYEYCVRVLRKHWSIKCRHGDTGAGETEPPAPALGPLDAVSGFVLSRLRPGPA